MRGGRHRTWGWGLWLGPRGGGGRDSGPRPLFSMGLSCHFTRTRPSSSCIYAKTMHANSSGQATHKPDKGGVEVAWSLQERSTGAQSDCCTSGGGGGDSTLATGRGGSCCVSSVCDGFAGERSAWGGNVNTSPLSGPSRAAPVWDASAVVDLVFSEIFPLSPRAAPQQETGNCRLRHGRAGFKFLVHTCGAPTWWAQSGLNLADIEARRPSHSLQLAGNLGWPDFFLGFA